MCSQLAMRASLRTVATNEKSKTSRDDAGTPSEAERAMQLSALPASERVYQTKLEEGTETAKAKKSLAL